MLPPPPEATAAAAEEELTVFHVAAEVKEKDLIAVGPLNVVDFRQEHSIKFYTLYYIPYSIFLLCSYFYGIFCIIKTFFLKKTLFLNFYK